MQASLAIAKESANAAMQAARSMHAADRAYIKISYVSPGLTFDESAATVMYGNVRTGTVEMEVSNIGKTPARITGFVRTVSILPHEKPLSPKPPYDTGDTERPEVITTMYGSDAMSPKIKINLSTDQFTAINTQTS